MLGSAFGTAEEEGALKVEYFVSWQSLFIAFAIGGLLTLLVVAFSAWRVSVMTISTAIRNLPGADAAAQEAQARPGGGSRSCLGLLLTLSGASGDAATPLMLGVSLVLVGLVPILRVAGVPERVAYTSCGLAIAVANLLPWSLWEDVFGQMAMDFSTWIVSGLMTVIGAVWVMVYNADVLLRGVSFVLSPFGKVVPVTRMAITYPLRARFRTGATLAMFTLVVFTLVTGTAAPSSFDSAINDVDQFGGGFQVRAGTSANAPIDNLRKRDPPGAGHRPERLHGDRQPVGARR